jgi:hypothetical protein
MSDAPSESEAQCHSTQGKSSTSSPATAPEMLAPEVTPGLLAGVEPNAHQFLCRNLINGVVEWKETQESSIDTGTKVWYVESKGGLDPTSVNKLIKGW